jgi:hypothetical protein
MIPPEQITAAIDAIPFPRGDAVRIVEVFATESILGDAAAAVFPHANIVRRAVRLETLDWWDVMFGADVVLIGGGLQALNDAKKQYLYKAVADRVSARGGVVIADAVEPQQILHHLIWLKHAGFGTVDCYWLVNRRSVFGGFK